MQGRFVQAVTHPSGRRTIVENMADVGIAQGAADLHAFHQHAGIVQLANILFGQRSGEAGPARSGIEFGFGAEQRRRTTDAAEQARLVHLIIGAGVRRIGAGAARDVELRIRQRLFPFGIGANHALFANHTGLISALVELRNIDIAGGRVVIDPPDGLFPGGLFDTPKMREPAA